MWVHFVLEYYFLIIINLMISDATPVELNLETSQEQVQKHTSRLCCMDQQNYFDIVCNSSD